MKNNRRNFLKTAGTALVAASVPAAIMAQSNKEQTVSANNLKQMILFGGVSEPNVNLPGIFGQVCYQFQMRADIGGTGFAAISDPVFTEINSHIQIQSGRRSLNDVYIFRGTVLRSFNAELLGKSVIIQVQVLQDDNCNVSLTVENTPLAVILLPAIQKVRDKNGL